MSKKVIVEYKTRQDYCHCCNQKLPDTKTSDIRKFELNEEDLISWCNWKEIAEFDDDLREVVREFVFDTIHFYAVSSYDQILIENSEINKVRDFIRNEVINQ